MPLRKILSCISLFTLLLTISTGVKAWDGFDYETGAYVEISQVETVKPGVDIEIYDHNDESYHDVQVQSVSINSVTEIEVWDYDLGEYRIFEMEKT